MSDNKEDRIKARAHQIWEREGGKHGEHDRHWHQATREVESEEGGKATKVSKTMKSTPQTGKTRSTSEAKSSGKKASAAVSTKSMDENASVLGDDRDKTKSPSKAMPDDGVAAAVPKTAGAAATKAPSNSSTAVNKSGKAST